jgi:hypothetical protein
MDEGDAPRAPRAAKAQAVAKMAQPTAEEKAAVAAALKAAKASKAPRKARGAVAKSREAKAAAKAGKTEEYVELTKEELELENLRSRFDNVWYVSSRGSVKAEIAANRKIVNQGNLNGVTLCFVFTLYCALWVALAAHLLLVRMLAPLLTFHLLNFWHLMGAHVYRASDQA